MMLKARLTEVRLALMLLTRFPVGNLDDPAPTMGASAWAWPLAGLAVSAPSALVYYVLYSAGFGAQISALGMVGTATVLSGALHEDGLADMADGFGGGQTKQRKLEIMRDSRIGSYGVLALIFAVAFHISFIAALETPRTVLFAAIGIAMASRGALPLWLHLMPPARQDGLGRAATSVPKAGVSCALAIGFVSLLPLGLIPALIIFAALMVCGGLVCLLAMKQIGGQTGDVIGAIQKLSELSGWAVLLVLL